MFSVRDALRSRALLSHPLIPKAMPVPVVLSFFQYSVRKLSQVYEVHCACVWLRDYAFFYLLSDVQGNYFALLSIGFGAAPLAMLLHELAFFQVKYLVVCGSAAALSPVLGKGSLLVPNAVMMHDAVSVAYLPELQIVTPSPKLLKIAGEYAPMPLCYGTCVSVMHPYLCADALRVAPESADVLAVDMELASFFAVGKVLGLECLGILTVSDAVSEGRAVSFFASSMLQRRKWQLLHMAQKLLVHLP